MRYRKSEKRKTLILLQAQTILLLFFCLAFQVSAQDGKVQNPDLNNLKLPDGYITSEPEVVHFKKSGTGKTDVVLIAGWGFGAKIFDSFISGNSENYTMYAVTLPGFSNTKAPPIPKEGTSYGSQTWTRNAVQGVVNLIKTQKLSKPVIVGHFLTGAQVALEVAIDHPDIVGKVIVVSGSPKVGIAGSPIEPTLDQRIKLNDTYYGPKWFKTVTKKAWDSGNYPPELYTQDPELAQRLWNESAEEEMPIMIQYLLEYYASDLSLEFERIETPTLVMIPSFTEELFKKHNYLKPSFVDSWKDADKVNPLITLEYIGESNFFVMLDQPGKFKKTIAGFISDQK